jgi:hemoglobin/transferrin/lactoferrin receptor protein
MRLTASYQNIEESRYQRDRGNPVKQNRIENVQVAGLLIDFRKKWEKHEISTGIDVQMNDVRSKAYTLNINTGARGKLDTRYPEENSYNSVGIYAQHIYKMADGKLVLNDGIRLQGNWLHSTIIDQSTGLRPYNDIKQSPVGASGNLGLAYMPNAGLRINGGLATGFRAPNIDDLAKIFESSTAQRQLVIPNPDLKPEYTITPELNVQKSLWENLVKLEAGVYYTWFRNAIVKDKYPVNGQDSIVYNGQKYQTLASQNNAKANLYGWNVALSVLPAKGLEIASTLTYTYGQYTRPNGIKVPLDHIPPMFGKTSIRYSARRWNAELWSMYNAWKRIEDYNPDGEDNAQYATPDGMPSWVTFNVRGQFTITKNLSIQAAVENLADRNYRVFSGGFSAPGRNFLTTLRLGF